MRSNYFLKKWVFSFFLKKFNRETLKFDVDKTINIYSNARPATKAVRIEKNIVTKINCITFRKTV